MYALSVVCNNLARINSYYGNKMLAIKLQGESIELTEKLLQKIKDFKK